MGRKHLGMLAVVCGLLFAAMPALAHHSIASEYDFDKPLELTGVLTRVEFINPHSLFQLEVTGADGTKTEWVFQAGGAGNIRHQLNFLKPTDMLGKTYTFYGFGLKTGKPGGFVKGIKMPDGRMITMWLGDPNGN
jgi:hypothetical protein